MTPDGRIVFLDHDTFQFAALTPRDTADDYSSVSINIDIAGDTMTFASTTEQPDPRDQQELNGPDMHTSSQDDARTFSTLFDELSALFPGCVWPPMSEWATAITGGSTPDTSSLFNSLATVLGTGPAGLDWWVTPDFDDDPGWYPGWIPSSSPSANSLGADEGGEDRAPTSSALTSSLDQPVTTSLTPADLNELYPGIVWPADWWTL